VPLAGRGLRPTLLRQRAGRPQLKRDPLGEHTTFERTLISVKPIPAFFATWALTGLGAVVGSVLGHGAGKRGLFAGAVVGGVLGVGAAVVILARLQWLSLADRRGAFIGGIVGFAVAAPIAVSNLLTPITPVLACALAGAGLVLGVRLARGWGRRS
jgi:hypothetical protein